ncbi:hypothetical protein FOZ61_004163 [Perkinsus olseni]|uniref:Uncharacterized protein n=1 Tax=Perkinsus olseni TaxID=32597 RepID=A0A7J6LMH0_PEROL|nr:hypothetical protein FOZ61_004163 [Perkinsus olseni]KAF4665027.1 hypothetical protein FOL46_003912 [Perkinsus olseni]
MDVARSSDATQHKLSSLDDIPPPLAAVAHDSEDPFWTSLAEQMQDDLSLLGIDDSVILPVLAYAAENNEDPFYVSLLSQVFAADSSTLATGATDLSRSAAIQAKDTTNPFVLWLLSIFFIF